MAEVTWQARRIQDSVLVDVTSDIEGTAQGAPTQNPIEGAQTIRLLGPFGLAFATVETYPDALNMGEVAVGTLILDTFLFIGAPWAAAGVTGDIKLYVGVSTTQPYPDSQYGTATYTLWTNGVGAAGHNPGHPAPGDAAATSPTARMVVAADSVLTANLSLEGGVGAPTAGTADLYALIAEPAA